MAEKESRDFEDKVGFVLGIVSLIMSISLFSPLGGVVSGIFGLVLVKGSNSNLAKKAKKLNKWGIFIGALILVVLVSIAVWASLNNIQQLIGEGI